jgi:hypothetical protein
MSGELTVGAVRDRLRENGYAPCSVLSPLEKRGYRIADDPAGILCMPNDRERRVVSLIVTAADKTLRAAILGVIERQGLGRGPVRSGADGSEHRPLRFDEYEVAPGRSWSPFSAPAGDDPAVIVEYAGSNGPGMELVSAVMRVAGAWRGGSPLDTPRGKLPAIDLEGIKKLFRELGTLPTTSEPWVAPPLQFDRGPSLRDLNGPRMVGPRSKKDLSGQPALLVAHMEAVRRGEEEELPDLPPEETLAVAAAPVPPSLLSRVFGR